MGRYSVPLAPRFADLASVVAGQRVVDVGCGPGALTAELVVRVGAAAVAAVDPSESFVAAAQERHPTVEVHRAAAEQLPFEDDSFDAAVAQLVVHFMADPIAGLREMARVTRPDGVVAACVWDHQGGSGPLSLFWRAVHDLDASFAGEAGLAGAGDGQLVRLFREAGLRQVEQHLAGVDGDLRGCGVVGQMEVRLHLDDLVSGRLKLEQINEGFDALKKGGVARNVIVFDQ